jgi:hypothetical protein
MSVPGDDLAGFERRVRAVLEHDAGGLSGRVRSRLTRARHVAVAGARARRDTPHWRLLRTWLPATATAAAALAAVWLLRPYRTTPAPRPGTGIVTTQDVQLLTDRDGLALVEEGDGEFYEWAVARARSKSTSAAGGRGPGKHGG